MKFFTLLEFIIVMAIAAILFAATFQLFSFGSVQNPAATRFKIETTEINTNLRGTIYTMIDSTDSSRYIVIVHPNGVAMVKQDR
jgi:prepilin-type N-terminal cleavage/methylation domain-containing protein